MITQTDKLPVRKLNTTIIFCTGGMLLVMLSPHVKSQDCKTHYEANAGPDINVCEGGTVQLNGTFGGDATEATWHGGKGIFLPGRNSAETEYTPAAEETGKNVVLTLMADNPK